MAEPAQYLWLSQTAHVKALRLFKLRFVYVSIDAPLSQQNAR